MIPIPREVFLPRITLEAVKLLDSKWNPQLKENAMKMFRNLGLIGCWLL